MRNCYKREDVFICRHDSHRGFDHRISAHHVLVEKRCDPHGCIEFLWKCKRLDKGGACPKGYQHVGSNCTQCRFYDEEKIQRRPERLLNDTEFRAFLAECREFDDWVAGLRGRRSEVGGEITDMRPNLVREIDGHRSRLSLRGFLVRLQRGYVGLVGLEDPLYLRVGRAQQQRARMAPGDRIDCLAEVELDRGRLVAVGPRRILVEERGGQTPASWDQALFGRVCAAPLPGQPERCLQCERGVLVDVHEVARRRGRARREVICLEGISSPSDCPYEALAALREAAGSSCRRAAPAG